MKEQAQFLMFGPLWEGIVKDGNMTKKEQFERILKSSPWPKEKPNKKYLDHGWLSEENKNNLAGILKNIDNPLVVEIGTWVGKSAKFMLDIRKDLRLITIDTFQGSSEHRKREDWKKIIDAGLQEQAICNLWEYKRRCCIMNINSHSALQQLYLKEIKPDLIYIDGNHEYPIVHEDICFALNLFENAIVCGDDVNWPGVRSALTDIGNIFNITSIYENGSFWRIFR